MRISSSTTTFDTSKPSSSLSIVGTISEGRMFRVLKARKGSKFVILKTPVTNDSMLLEILHREYELACNLHHPCIVNTLGLESDTPVGPAIVMEYIDGITLGEFIATRPTITERKAILNDILNGIDYLHHRGITHNDLKPDNIIVNSNKTARIIDFGFSASNDSAYKGYIGGSDGYTAPEILDGSGPAGTASDIYTIGRLISLIFDNRKYENITLRCCNISPSERPQNIQALRSLICRKERMPLIATSAALSLVLIGFFSLSSFNRYQETRQMERRITNDMHSVYQKTADEIKSQALQDSIKTEERIAENITSYAQETELAKQAQLTKEQQHKETLRQQFEKIMNPYFEEAVAQMKKQQYSEMAVVYASTYYKFVMPYLQQITQKYPPLSDTKASDETTVVYEIFTKQHQTIDSLRTSLPSIETLPPSQRDSLVQVIEKLTIQMGL